MYYIQHMVEHNSEYQLDKQLSENELTCSWLGQNIKTKQPCFLKILNINSDNLSLEEKKKILSISGELQKGIKLSYIVTPHTIRETENSIILEYPFLSNDKFHQLSSQIFVKNWKTILPQICFVLDLLHADGIVHTDIKLDNFLYYTQSKKIYLIDLDFIVKEYSSCKGLVRGTGDHISPKIIHNEPIDKQVDYYSLGVMLEKIKLKDNAHILSFVNSLKQISYTHSFNTLIDGLKKHKLISKDEYETLNQKLFYSYILGQRKQKQKQKKTGIYHLLSVGQNILGINQDFLLSIDDKYKNNKKQTLFAIKKLLIGNQIRKVGQFWICDIPDENYQQLTTEILHCENNSEQLKLANKLMSKQQFYLLYWYLLYLHQNNLIHSSLSAEILKIAILASNAFGNYHQTLDFIRAYEEKHDLLPQTLMREKLSCLIVLKEYKAVESLLKKTKVLSSSEKQNYRALIALRRGEINKAEKLLLRLKKSNDSSNPYTQIQTEYYLIVSFWYKGELDKAIELGEYINKKGYTDETKSLFTANLSMLSLLEYNRGNYRQSIRYAQKGLKLCTTIDTFDKKKSFYTPTVYSLLNTNKPNKSMWFLLQLLETGSHKIDENETILLILNYGIYLKKTGDFLKAKTQLSSLLNSELIKTPSKNIGKIYQNLMVISWYTGDTNLLEESYCKAKEIFTKISDPTSLLEIEAVQESYLSTTTTNSGSQTLERIIGELFSKGSYFYGFRTLLALLLSQVKQKNKISSIKFDIIHSKRNESPFITSIIKFYEKLTSSEIEDNLIPILKSLIPHFLIQHEYYFYSYLLNLIGDQYYYQDNSKLALKYYTLAQESFRRLNNNCEVKKIAVKIAKIPKTRSNKEQYLIIKAISDLLSSIEDYSECTHRILQFALKQTGAERAVLLVKRQESTQLRVKASVNCDNESLKDIEDYSSSLTQKAFSSIQPIITNNALDDNHFSKYKSVLIHNIHSVIAIPLKKGSEVLGVLYMDHHSIPALFDSNDITFTHTVANMLAIVLSSTTLMHTFQVKNKELTEDIRLIRGNHQFITQDQELLRLFKQLERFSKSNTSILLLGESGTGKEILANMIHRLSRRSSKPLVKINAAAIPEKLFEAELFGIADKVATDVKGRSGKLEAADGSSLFIDEIGDMPLNIQAKILRAIENQEFEKVGSNKTIFTDIRFIYATNKNLKEMVEQKQFREDLYYRINTLPIHIPPLRKRKSDASLLIKEFLKIFKVGEKPLEFSIELLNLMETYDWPGNVRELRNVVERICLYNLNSPITLEKLPSDLKTLFMSQTTISPDVLEKSSIIDALKRHGWIQSRAASDLNISLSTFRRRLIKFDINQ